MDSIARDTTQLRAKEDSSCESVGRMKCGNINAIHEVCRVARGLLKVHGLN